MPLRELLTPPLAAKIQYKGYSFLITDRPYNNNLKTYTEQLLQHNVMALVRVCERSYSEEPLKQQGIAVYDLMYEDGMYPPGFVVDDWFQLLRKHFRDEPNGCVAVHCIAGLGRAPVMVALALIELGMTYEDAVELIREKRRGAINQKQLSFLGKYRPKSRLKRNFGTTACCVQ